MIRSLETSIAAGDTRNRAITSKETGRLYLSMGCREKARDYLEEALDLSEGLDKMCRWARSINSLCCP